MTENWDYEEGDTTMNHLFPVGAELFVEYIDRQGIVKSYRTSVYERTLEHLTILAPAERGILVPVRPMTQLVMWQVHGQEAFVSEVEVTDEYPHDPALISTTLPDEVEVFRRRRFFRIETELPYQADQVQGTIKDLSGSGMLVHVPPHSYGQGQKVVFQLQLPDLPAFAVQGRVVRVREQEGEEAVGIMFTRLADRWRDQIVSYVFKRQGQQLRERHQPQ